MARSRLTTATDDLMSDSGNVLFSFVKGEQLEFPITMNFVETLYKYQTGVWSEIGYVFEAVVVEAANEADQTTAPTSILTGGVQTILYVRVPVFKGNWDSAQAYNKEDVVAYAGLYYKLLAGAARVSATIPSSDLLWEETTIDKIYVQFPKTLAATWTQQPIVGVASYGFFELRVTEPTDAIFTRTWKPVRGLVEVLFSPTDLVPDA